MRYLTYLVCSLLAQCLAWLITPILPLFREGRWGYSDNGNLWMLEPRLPSWLSWFDTPDNSLLGDARWYREHPKGTYWNMVAWLYRNSLYGFKWTALSQQVQTIRQVTGSPDIGYQGERFGTLSIRQPNGAWQYKVVKPLFGKVFEGNFGWLLDDTSKQRALFMFSPRFK